MDEKLNNSVKILVGYHEPAVLLKDDILLPINGGRVLLENKIREKRITIDDAQWLIENTISDSVGDSISELNEELNELTIIYWAWKNYKEINAPDYIGFQHYRRHFVFNENIKPMNNRWTIDFDNYGINIDEYFEKIGYSSKKVQDLTTKYDCITAFADTDIDVYTQYHLAHGTHGINELNQCLSIIRKKYPAYNSAINTYINGKKHYFCNMFIMKKELFFEYCSFLFDVIFEFKKNRNLNGLSSSELRYFISERVTGIFMTYQKLKNMDKFKELNISLVSDVSVSYPIPKVYNKNSEVCVCLPTDENYLSVMGVCLTSIINNSNKDRLYDIVILHNNMDNLKIKEFLNRLEQPNNFSIRFHNVKNYFKEFDFSKLYIGMHVNVATFYRVLIQKVFEKYTKVLYLDTDIIVNKDISELYDTNLKGHMVAACRDLRENFAAKINLNVAGMNWTDYVHNKLCISDYNNYFQAGVLLFNVKKMISEDLYTSFIDTYNNIQQPILADQDVLNMVCNGDVEYVDESWNVEWQLNFEFPQYLNTMDKIQAKKYKESIENPRILHFASSLKPWKNPNLPNAHIWWKYASLSPFYEEFLYKFVNEQQNSELNLLKTNQNQFIESISYLSSLVVTLDSNLNKHKTTMKYMKYYVENEAKKRIKWYGFLRKFFFFGKKNRHYNVKYNKFKSFIENEVSNE